MKLLLMRHSDRDRESKLEERFQPVTALGRAKVERTAVEIRARLADGETIHSALTSPYKPAVETAEALRQALGWAFPIVPKDQLAPEFKDRVSAVIDLLSEISTSDCVLLVGHEPQLTSLIQNISSHAGGVQRAGIWAFKIVKLRTRDNIALWKYSPDPLKEEPMKWDLKLVSGVFFFLMNLATFVFGAVLMFRGAGLLLSGGGEGKIKLVVDKLGELTGINGQALILCAGFALVLASIGYARKAFQEARAFEGGLKDTIRHFSPV